MSFIKKLLDRSDLAILFKPRIDDEKERQQALTPAADSLGYIRYVIKNANGVTFMTHPIATRETLGNISISLFPGENTTNRQSFNKTKAASWEAAFSCLQYIYTVLRLAKPIKPIRPEPNNQTDAGNGTDGGGHMSCGAKSQNGEIIALGS